MDTYLNAGFGDLLSYDDLFLINALGYDGIRQDVPDAERAGALVENIEEGFTLNGIFVVPVAKEDVCHAVAHAISSAAVAMHATNHVVLEVGNEEDLGGKRWSRDPVGWAALVRDVQDIARQHSALCGSGPLAVVSGGVSSVSRQAMGWLERSRVKELGVDIGYHQYRSTPPEKPLDGYKSRDDEFRTLRDVAGERKLWCTESGWSTAPHKGGMFHRGFSYTDVEVLHFLREERELNKNFGAESFVVYQLNDGPDAHNDQDRFGIRKIDGALKTQSQLLLV